MRRTGGGDWLAALLIAGVPAVAMAQPATEPAAVAVVLPAAAASSASAAEAASVVQAASAVVAAAQTETTDIQADDDAQPMVSSVDPMEGFNRGVFAFNKTFDEKLARPIANAYQSVVPQPIRTGVSNFLGNIWDAWSAVNQLLQGKPMEATQMTLRVASNTLFGLGGVLDPATEFDLPRQSEDFGQTLGRWGLPAGPYIVLPLLGPSSVRDAGALLVDRQAAPSALFSPDGAQWSVASIEFVDARAKLLGADDLLSELALDEYLFMRDGYLSRRRNLVFDGNPPQEDEAEESAFEPPAVASAPASASSSATD